jgi:23S rRNA-/tRNA-specific pseudouridylate synthase
MRVDQTEEGKDAETHFRVLQSNDRFTLIEARPLTGRTHQIRVHLAESGSPIMCDELYGRVEKGYRLGLRAVRLAYKDTFTRRPVSIVAPTDWFLKEFGFTKLAKTDPKPAVAKPEVKSDTTADTTGN